MNRFKRTGFEPAQKGQKRQESKKIIFRPDNPMIFHSMDAALAAFPQTKKSDWLKADSTPEYKRFNFLLEAQRVGQISQLVFHPKFELLPSIKLPKNAFRPAVVTQRAITYEADFSYFWRGIYCIEDVKARYGNSEKNREKGIAGKPILQDGAGDKHKTLIAQMLKIHEHDFMFLIISNAHTPIGRAE